MEGEGSVYWPCIVEKAYAKLFSSVNGFEQIESGLTHKAINALTNASTQCAAHSSTCDRVISGKLWQDLLTWNRNMTDFTS